jgi:hypothetical protein
VPAFIDPLPRRTAGGALTRPSPASRKEGDDDGHARTAAHFPLLGRAVDADARGKLRQLSDIDLLHGLLRLFK